MTRILILGGSDNLHILMIEAILGTQSVTSCYPTESLCGTLPNEPKPLHYDTKRIKMNGKRKRNPDRWR